MARVKLGLASAVTVTTLLATGGTLVPTALTWFEVWVSSGVVLFGKRTISFTWPVVPALSTGFMVQVAVRVPEL